MRNFFVRGYLTAFSIQMIWKIAKVKLDVGAKTGKKIALHRSAALGRHYRRTNYCEIAVKILQHHQPLAHFCHPTPPRRSLRWLFAGSWKQRHWKNWIFLIWTTGSAAMTPNINEKLTAHNNITGGEKSAKKTQRNH